MPAYLDPVLRFWAKVDKRGVDDCWPWLAATDGHGYGAIGLSRPRRYVEKAPRYSWVIHNGAIPKGLWVLHRCDNRICVNPKHLFLGNRKLNSDDKVNKGRQARGSRHGLAVLTPASVALIRFKYASGQYLQKELASEYGVSRSCIGLITTKERWKHSAVSGAK